MLNINYCFLDDNPDYFKDYWENNHGMGGSAWDPDSKSITLQKYHQMLWSKRLPNGEYLHLEKGPYNSLLWKDMRFGSDSIIVSFRYARYKELIYSVQNTLQNYKQYYEDYIKRSYTIGGSIIFPKRPGGLNTARGFNVRIKDRFDLTLECIRRYYNNEESPLYEVIEKDSSFFELFIDFKGYVDFFYLQDMVNEDYSSVKFFGKPIEFIVNPLPTTVDEYLEFIANELAFVEARNARISLEYMKNEG